MKAFVRISSPIVDYPGADVSIRFSRGRSLVRDTNEVSDVVHQALAEAWRKGIPIPNGGIEFDVEFSGKYDPLALKSLLVRLLRDVEP